MADEWWRGATIYQIYPRSFQDSTGNGIGDLPGITRRLDHVADLGADAVWLSPVFTSPMKDMGYDVSDYTDIDPLFGTLRDMDALIERAHDLGLKVVVDQVISHCSDKHPWFEESRQDRTNPKADWFVWADPKEDGSPPNNWPSVFGGSAWTWEARRRQYYLHNFLPSQPDLNFHCAPMREAILGTMRFWLDRGIDGFRLDTVNYYYCDAQLRSNPPVPEDRRWDEWPPANPYEMQQHLHSKNQPENLGFMETLRTMTDGYDARMMVGEIGESLIPMEIMSEYTRGEKRLHMAYSFEMLGPNFSPRFYADRITEYGEKAPDGWPCWAFSNHDVTRHATRFSRRLTGTDDDRDVTDAVAKLSAALLLSFRGSVCLYQGEELGQIETDILYEELTDPPAFAFWPDYKGRDGCRTPMVWTAQDEEGGFTDGTPWLPVKEPQLERAVDLQGEGSVLACYKALLAQRRARQELLTGDIAFPHVGARGLVIDRDGLKGVFNLSAEPLGLTGEERTGPAEGWDGSALAPFGWAFFEGEVAVEEEALPRERWGERSGGFLGTESG
ncbi:alpha-glucosidase [Hasllibacter halocynthiae]|uniref:Alpha-glucosidase n=1 Tax=Hasllibacter halocynthiae TaxID=595589 RepID=A0A2T0X7H1_9RHOB|nr:alpha-amylase family glycosyl hydrolase [Hasllibacter halocynthiae]PRY94845.1 alpha-glucosidase [Hasllibacter halocynthiae]